MCWPGSMGRTEHVVSLCTRAGGVMVNLCRCAFAARGPQPAGLRSLARPRLLVQVCFVENSRAVCFCLEATCLLVCSPLAPGCLLASN